MTLKDIYYMYAEDICIALEDQNTNLHTALTKARKEAVRGLKSLNLKPHEIVYQISKFKEYAKKDINI